jgi:hypothetical protein
MHCEDCLFILYDDVSYRCTYSIPFKTVKPNGLACENFVLQTFKRFYCPDSMAKKAGHQIPTGALISVIRFLPKGRAVISYQGKKYLTFSICCRKNPPRGR